MAVGTAFAREMCGAGQTVAETAGFIKGEFGPGRFRKRRNTNHKLLLRVQDSTVVTLRRLPQTTSNRIIRRRGRRDLKAAALRAGRFGP